jgi:hypothetical protein
MCGGRSKLVFWLLSVMMLGICGLCVYITIRRKAFEEQYMFCKIVGTPAVQEVSGTHSIVYQVQIASPTGYTGTCSVAGLCLDAACNQTQPLPSSLRCWEASLDSSEPVCDQPLSYWRSYMYTCAAFGLAGFFFVAIALYASGCFKSRDDYNEYSRPKKSRTSIIPLSSQF